MKYKKGTFIVTPNKQYLKGKPSEMQSIYFWLCEHADENGGCFPSKDLLADEAGCSHNTADKYLKQLSDEGFIKITNRRKKESQEFTSNHYQILIIARNITRNPNLGSPSTKNGTTPTPNIGTVTNPSINEPNLNLISEANEGVTKKTKKQIREETPFVFKEELEALWNDGWKGSKIIYTYLVRKKFMFENRLQFDAEVGRDKVSASKLLGYSARQINDTMNYLDNNSKNFTWKLETVVKTIADVINR